MKPAKDIQESIKNLTVECGDRIHNRILDKLLIMLDRSEKTTVEQTSIWRIIMKSRVSKIAAAAAIIVLVVLSMTLIDRSATSAYAIEQTIEAMRSVSSVRAYISDGEVLFQINPETGQEECYRVDQEDVLTVATPEKTYYYYKDKNLVKISDEYITGVEVRFSRFIEDMADWAQEHNRKMDHRLEFDQELQKEVIKVYIHPAQGNSGGQDTINVDPKTKLPISFGTIRLEYNVPIPPGSFDFEIPEGAEVVYE
ncbi:MAG: hypothetical protein AMJ65_07885 [Phycisphaerae bacterium SG8_4]|nr:MAG: hypothetical protein AMJ65_07885 [Phycisphaerae bacterium SG8_4]